VSFTSRIDRSVLRILLIGGLAALAVVLGGWLVGRARLGTSDREGFARLERQVRGQFDEISRSLERMASAVATPPDRLVAAVHDQSAVRALFDAVDVVWQQAGGSPDLAITVYGPDAQPLAWSGRPSEIVRARLTADQSTIFPARGSSGLRLVCVRPVLGADGRRLGTIATERLLSTRRGIANLTAEDYTLATSVGEISLRLRAEGAGDREHPYTFLIRSPHGEVMLEASVKPDDLRRARARWTDGMLSLVLAIAALTVVLLIDPLLDRRAASRHMGTYLAITGAIVALIAGAWSLLTIAGRSTGALSGAFAPSISGQPLASSLFRSPFDFLLSSLALLALVAILFDIGEGWRLRARRRRRAVTASPGAVVAYVGVQLGVGAAFSLLLAAYQLFLRATFIQARIDILNFSVHPWSAARLSLALSLVLFHACVLWLGVLAFRLAVMPWRRAPGVRGSLLLIAAWTGAFSLVVAIGASLGWRVPWMPTALAYVAVVVAAAFSPRIVPRFRHASQGFRLILAFLAVLLPAVVMYPTLMHFADRANRVEIERSFAPEVMNQREAIKTHLANAMDQIDAMPALAGLVESAAVAGRGAPGNTEFSTVAFSIWSKTDLATSRIASAIEVYSADGTMVSRFALYLPEYRYTSAAQRTETPEENCAWDLYEYVSRFGSQERKLLHAGRAICVPGPAAGPIVVGSIVIHAMLDYSALPFLSSQNPYYELLRPTGQRRREGVPAGEVDLTVYGWSGTQIYTSATVASPLGEELFRRAYASRQPFWTSIDIGGVRHDVYFMNDRGGIYALAYPTVPPIGHLVNLAELTTLVGLGYLAMLGGSMLFRVLSGHRSGSGRALLREIRASFYRKVFLAFVAVAVIPVITLAIVAQAYIGGRLRTDTEAAAVRTGAVAQRVIQDFNINMLMPDVRANRPEAGLPAQMPIAVFDDDIMVWLSGVIDQDVNVFMGPEVVATSERDLFESQMLPKRTPADVYRAIALDRRSSFVGQERSGEFPYMLAAAPIRMGDREAILTVPLMLRQQEIEREIDDMNRRIVLASLLFSLIGAGIGYTMAERIADPVNRLTRATRRIARGDLHARIAATSSDELRRLVEAFNSMAADLQRQREQLERTNRLEAWHEMARQVAHEIKNPLTPIQLSAEHLQRVHADRGRPLSPVLDDCINSILSQVRLLRQISAEFSSFASSPTASPAPTSLVDLIDEVVGPYRSGLAGRVDVSEDLPATLPPVFVDRTLIGRALANIVENALHAMPGTGTLSVRARELSERGKPTVQVALTDTGIGMDAEALARLFEPYFSTRAIGTGLGLAIAKRNITLNGGTITVESQKGKGTTVYLNLPVAEGESAVSDRQVVVGSE
jgi:signal transduction histidine kinase